MTKRRLFGLAALAVCIIGAAMAFFLRPMWDKHPAWATAALKNGPAPGITGTLRYHRAMKGEGLKDRDIVIWLPPDYDSAPDRRYGVLYMQDGQNLFDPKTTSFGVDWAVDESMDRLIRAHEIPPMIVVGLYNTPDRTPEYAPGALGEAYMKFMVDTVKPFIDSHYRTLPDRAHTLVGGSSSGGLIACMLAWKHPEVYGAALCFSPAFHVVPMWDKMDFFRDTPVPSLPVHLYMDVGGIGLEERLKPGVDDMVALLKADRIADGTGYTVVIDPKAEHNEAAWAKRFPGAILWAVRQLQDKPTQAGESR